MKPTRAEVRKAELRVLAAADALVHGWVMGDLDELEEAVRALRRLTKPGKERGRG